MFWFKLLFPIDIQELQQLKFTILYFKHNLQYFYNMKFSDEAFKKDLVDILNAKMPFGKYQDKPLVYLPDHYLTWFKGKGFPRGKLGKQLAAVQDMKANGLEEFLIDIFKKRNSIR